MAHISTMGNTRESKLYFLAPVVTADLSMDTAAATSPTSTISLSASMSPLVRPPTQGGGPLSSHPTTPIDVPGAWISTSDLLVQNGKPSSPTSSASRSISTGVQPARHDSFRTPQAPASAYPQRRPSEGVRKLLSLSSLRNSFMGPRNSDLAPKPVQRSVSSYQVGQHGEQRPSSRLSSFGLPQGTKRSASTSMPIPPPQNTVSRQELDPPLRKKKSASWFRRKSQVLIFGHDDTLESVMEGQGRPETDNVEKTYQNDARRLLGSRQSSYGLVISNPRPISRASEFPGSRPVSRAFDFPESRPSSRGSASPKSRQSSYAIDVAKSRKPSYALEPPERRYLAPPSPIRQPSPPPQLELDMLEDGGSFVDENMFANIGR